MVQQYFNTPLFDIILYTSYIHYLILKLNNEQNYYVKYYHRNSVLFHLENK